MVCGRFPIHQDLSSKLTAGLTMVYPRDENEAVSNRLVSASQA